ncbi:MAG: hypothetical protein JST92_25975, partial [Deltaproteobacteria bacterium]|nr:hypothetical protein [Deltaproteobacteria bacterium]
MGCAGSGSSCGSSCGGAFTTTDSQGRPFKYTGDKLDNVAQVRVTQQGFDFLNAGTLNNLITGLNSAGTGFNLPCIDAIGELNFCNVAGAFDITKVKLLAGDSNFDGQCTAADQTPINVDFKEVTWQMDPANQLLRAKIITHIHSGSFYIRTREAHSSICSGTTPIQARLFINDELFCPVNTICPQNDTELDLDLSFSTAPDGRLILTPTQASLDAILSKFNVASFQIDGNVDQLAPIPPASGKFVDNGCDSVPNGTYTPTDGNGHLACSGLANVLSGGCDSTNSTTSLWCQVFSSARDYLLNYVKTQFKDQIVGLIRTQLDNIRCVRSTNSQGDAVACDATHHCPSDDDGTPLSCDTAR